MELLLLFLISYKYALDESVILLFIYEFESQKINTTSATIVKLQSNFAQL